MPTTKHAQRSALNKLTATALLLPGLLPALTAQAQTDDTEVDFQYTHYQEGKRELYADNYTEEYNLTESLKVGKALPVPQNLNPIEADTLRGRVKLSLTDRIKFAFNYTQDTWSGATPIGSAPVVIAANSLLYRTTGKYTDEGFEIPIRDANGNVIPVGASPLANPQSVGDRHGYLDAQGNYYFKNSQSYPDGNFSSYPGQKYNGITHVMSFASPETRQQGDFKLSYEFDNAALDIGGGISVENDFESRFGSLGGRFDFNQKQTTLNWGLSYTNSDTHALLDPNPYDFMGAGVFEDVLISETVNPSKQEKVRVTRPKNHAGVLTTTYTLQDELSGRGEAKKTAILSGNRQDWGVNLGLSQVLGKATLVDADFAYTRSTGFLSNPWKAVYITSPIPQAGYAIAAGGAQLEVRPDERNQYQWHVGLHQLIEPLDAALHFNYRFTHDDWGINAHTFEGDWVQPLGAGWTLTPRLRYYSQSAADFYMPFVRGDERMVDVGGNAILPDVYSSDQRLSGFGTLSGGLTVAKEFARGVGLELGFEYYTHQGALKLGGGGEQDFADYDYWVANAALKFKLDALAEHGGHSGHQHHDHHHHPNSPAGVMFDHTLAKAGDFMVGYRFMRSQNAGGMLLGDHAIGLDAVRYQGCKPSYPECLLYPQNMVMNMHMLDLMVAPTNWLTLMLMPQWMDMDMTMERFNIAGYEGAHNHASVHSHQVGGIGDLGLYALFKVFERSNHHLTLSLGGTAPTGDVDIVLRKTAWNWYFDKKIHYAMQLGSGTWDFKPALTYTGEADKFSWGAQANATVRLEDRNESNFVFGDSFQGSLWGGYQWTNWLATTVRGVYTWQDRIRGEYPQPTITTGPIIPSNNHNGPFDETANYGGQFVDLGLGVNVTIPSGAFAGNSFKFEWLQPVHTDYNGYQLDRDYALNFTWSYGF
jgi:Protein of unknown function (DUF3570)